MECQKCVKCEKLRLGELQSICKHCGYSDGDDRWNARSSVPKTFKLLY